MKLNNYLLVILFFIFFGCKQKHDKNSKPQQPPPSVDVIIARSETLNNTIEVNGTVVPDEFVELRPEISGILTYLNIPEGSFVNKGTVLARINNKDLMAQLNKLNVQLSLAKATEQRYKKLVDINGINRADYDAALNQVNSLQADINAQQVFINKSIVKAPFSGTLGLRQVSPGAYVSNATVLSTLQKTDRVKIDFNLPEQYSNTISKGKSVEIVIDNDTTHKTTARVIAIEPQANSSTRSLLVRAMLEHGNTNPGSFVKVLIKNTTTDKIVLVPTSAIIPEDLSKSLVTVKNGKSVYVKVKTGSRSASNISVLQGITEGDTVVVTGVLFTKPNAPVKIRSIKKLSDFE